MIHCQYVYGIGHFVRATELARGLRHAFDVHLVSGGEPIANFDLPEGITFTQLPAIFRDEASGHLVSVDPTLSLEACLARRTNMLEHLVQTRPPDIVVTEHFPFGLLFENEVVALLKSVRQAKPRAMVVSSVRDVIDAAQGGSNDPHICALLARWFDLILVHGDARAIPLGASFPLIEQVTVPHCYTGYVVEFTPPRQARTGLPLLVGSIGGGRVGQELLSALIAAHRQIGREWAHELLLFRGAFAHDAPKEELAPTLEVRAFDRLAYRHALARAHGVICLGGYNSVAEVLSMALPALVYKRRFAGANREQALRADLFKQSGLIQTIEVEDLAPTNLARLMRSHFDRPDMPPPDIDFAGASNTCRILRERWHVRDADSPRVMSRADSPASVTN
jgi:predicted glycosyltransferase